MNFVPQPASAWERADGRQPRLLRCGLYDFFVARAAETSTRRGCGVLRLTLCIHEPWDDGAGYRGGGETERLVDDLLPADDVERLWQFTRTTGLEDSYALGRLEAVQCFGAQGTCKIGIEPGQPDGLGGRSPDRNRVLYYVCDPAQVGVCF